MSREDARINFTTPESVKDDLIAVAKKHNRNLSQELNVIIAEYLDRESRAHPCGADGDGARATANGKPLPDAVEELFARINELEKRTGVTQNAGRDAKMSVKIGK